MDENFNNPDIQDFLKKIEVYAHPGYGKTILDDPGIHLSKVQVTVKGKPSKRKGIGRKEICSRIRRE
ncbi:MAG: hypothetical protein SWO11_08625 [Thermodesulfobacteriota bacterium]|nr:hypothetical protein [Thermodesulfobacteriota bacterium]